MMEAKIEPIDIASEDDNINNIERNSKPIEEYQKVKLSETNEVSKQLELVQLMLMSQMRLKISSDDVAKAEESEEMENDDNKLQIKSSPPPQVFSDLMGKDPLDIIQIRTCKKCGHPLKGHLWPRGDRCQQIPLSEIEIMKQQEIRNAKERERKRLSDKKRSKVNKRIHTGEGLYPCELCEKTFTDTSGLKRHLRIHTGERPHTCEHCAKTFIGRGDLTKHLKIHTGKNTCQECLKPFANLKRHMRIHSLEKSPYHCDLCNKSFFYSTYSHFKAHLAMHKNDTSDPSYQCTLCPRSFSMGKFLNAHIKNVHSETKPEDRYQCDQCSKSYKSKFGLKDHSLTHKGIKPFHCDQCPKSFRSKIGLKAHTRTHTGEKPFLCNLCPAAFSQTGGLAVHLKMHEVEKPYVCTVCERTFTLDSKLKKHLKNYHTGRKEFPCTLCPRIYNVKDNLKMHLRIHTGEKPYSCDICMRKFGFYSAFKRHQGVHSKEGKKEKCDMCAKTFPSVGYLEFHRSRSHKQDNEDKEFKCEQCPKSYASKQKLRDHIYKHTGEKPYICPFCSSAFDSSNALARHKQGCQL